MSFYWMRGDVGDVSDVIMIVKAAWPPWPLPHHGERLRDAKQDAILALPSLRALVL